MSDNTKQLSTDKTAKIAASDDKSLESGDDTAQIQSSDDLALNALSKASKTDFDKELDESNQLAETLTALQNLIEKNATSLANIGDELKQKRESLRSVFDNDTELSEAAEEAEAQKTKVKERRTKIQTSPQALSLKTEISNLNEEKKEIEESLSDYLINYHSLTNSTSFDTSDGDQWEFKIRARIKPRKKK